MRLRNCPCCGGKAELRVQLELENRIGYWVECVECGLQTDGGCKEDFEVQRWNQRVDETEEFIMNAKQAKKNEAQ